MKHGAGRVKKYIAEYEKLLSSGKIEESKELYSSELDFLGQYNKYDMLVKAFQFGYMVAKKG